MYSSVRDNTDAGGQSPEVAAGEVAAGGAHHVADEFADVDHVADVLGRYVFGAQQCVHSTK